MTQASILTAFAVPIVNLPLAGDAGLNEELRRFFVDCAGQGARYANSERLVQRNATLFESTFNLFDWDQPAVRRLRDICMTALYQTVGELNGYDRQTLSRLHVAMESWFHVTRRGGFFGAHNHPLHSWSGVYCVCQEGDESDEHSGRLTFISPHAMNTMFVDMASHKLKPPFHAGSWPVRLSPGQLVLFPSWLLHEVTPFNPADDGLRITVAFNARFRMEDVPQTPLPPAFA